MSHLQEQYKNPRQGFGNTGHGRIIRAYNQVKSRKEIRTRDFAKNRKLQDASISISPHCANDVFTVTDERAKRLLKWKEERDRKKKLTNATKKPAFKVGVVHHSFYSPMNKDYTVPTGTVKSFNQVKPPNVVQKRITRATEKRLLAKAAVNAAAKNTVKDIVNHKSVSVNHTKVEKSFAPDSHKFRPPSGLSKVPLFGAVAIEQTPLEKTDFFLNKPIEYKAQDANNQEHPQDLDLNTDTAVKISENSRLSSDEQKLSESTCNLNNTISDMNKIITTKLSLSEQNVQEPLQEEKSLPNNIDMETPVKSSEKENCEEDLIFFSPYLTLSRGKKNARKEQMLRRGFSNSPSHTIPTKDTVMKNLNISVEEEERTAQYFKFLLNKEIDRLEELCTKWLNIRLEQDVPEDAMYEISQAVGQTNLLLNKKFERFRGLVLDCETGKGQMLVTCKDLQGFWDMTLMEVRDCDLRFEKLEQRRDREWQEEQSIIVKPITKKRMTTKRQIVSSKPSSLRSLILAARRKKMTESSSIDDTLPPDTTINKDYFMSSSSILPVASEENINTRDTRKSKLLDDSGFKSTSCKRNNSRTSLVKHKSVQLSDKVKEMRSPLAIMKISKICKTPEIQLDDTISYINSDQTPGKSILKKTEEMVNNESRIKSAHKVIFDDQVALTEVSDDEESQTKRNLAAALSKIDSLDLDDLYSEKCINVEKKLIFDTEDSDSSGNFEFLSSEVQTLLKKKENAPKSSVCNIPDFTMSSLNVDTTSAMSLKDVSAKDNKKDNKKTKALRRSLRRQSQHKNTINSTLEIPVINILPTTPLHANIETSVTPKTPVIHETILDAENTKQELDLEIKILRSRIITTNNTPKIKKESIMMTPKKASVSKKENKSPVTSDRKKSSKLLQMDEDNCTQSDENNVEINKNIYRKRRSSRKSVAFDAEACFVCAENKPVLPMTPHSKRGTPSRQSRSKRTFDENLMLKETAKCKF